MKLLVLSFLLLFGGTAVNAGEPICENYFERLNIKSFQSSSQAIRFRSRLTRRGSELTVDSEIRLKDIDPLFPVLDDFSGLLVKDKRGDELSNIEVVISPQFTETLKVVGHSFLISSDSSAAELLIALKYHFGYKVVANVRAVQALEDLGLELRGFSSDLSEDQINRITDNFVGAIKDLNGLGPFEFNEKMPRVIFYTSDRIYDELYTSTTRIDGVKVPILYVNYRDSRQQMYNILRNRFIDSEDSINAQVRREFAEEGFDLSVFSRNLSEEAIRSTADRFLGAFNQFQKMGLKLKDSVPRTIVFTDDKIYDDLYTSTTRINGVKTPIMYVNYRDSEEQFLKVMRNRLADYTE